MRELLIEYTLDGHQRGYRYTSSTQGIHDDALKSIWRQAMPRGKGWAGYVGARSLKSFTLDDGRVALSETVVTPMRDEVGRGGIRRTSVQVMLLGEYQDILHSRLAAYPEAVQAQIAKRPSLGEWTRMMNSRVPKVHGEGQLILSADYQTAEGWMMIEALTLKIAASPRKLMFAANTFIPFTSLALDYSDESWLVAVPDVCIPAQNAQKLRVIRLA